MKLNTSNARRIVDNLGQAKSRAIEALRIAETDTKAGKRLLNRLECIVFEIERTQNELSAQQVAA